MHICICTQLCNLADTKQETRPCGYRRLNHPTSYHRCIANRPSCLLDTDMAIKYDQNNSTHSAEPRRDTNCCSVWSAYCPLLLSEQFLVPSNEQLDDSSHWRPCLDSSVTARDRKTHCHVYCNICKMFVWYCIVLFYIHTLYIRHSR